MYANRFNCVLLCKDFDAKGFETNTDLISNAETPYLAVHELIKNPVNPYTKNIISSFKEQTGQPELIYNNDFQISKNNGNVFLPSDWFTVKNNIYDSNNWSYLGNH